MAIKNEFLKDYIHRNTVPKIRQRAKSVYIKTLVFDEGLNSAKAIVIGNQKYDVNFYGLKSGLISSSCTCPYNYEGLCKHQVAVANEIDKKIGLNKGMKIAIELPKESPKPKYSKKGSYRLPFKEVSDLNNSNLKKNSTKTAYKASDSWYLGVEAINVDSQTKHIIAKILDNTTYETKKEDIVIKIEEKELNLSCSCSALNNNLCRHQINLLIYLRDKLPHFFLSKEKIKELQEEKLKEYGFSLNHPKVQTYFDFEFTKDGVEVFPKKKGLLRLCHFNDFKIINDEILDEESIVRLASPPEKNREKKKESVAVGIILEDQQQPIMLIPLKGKLNAKGELSSNIREINSTEYLIDKNGYSIKEQQIIEMSFQCSHEQIEIRDKDVLNYDKIVINTLKELIPNLKNHPLYCINDYSHYEKYSKRDLTPINISLEHPELSFKLIEEEDFYLLESYIKINGRKSKLSKRNLGNNFLLIKKEKEGYVLLKSVEQAKTLNFFRNNSELRFLKSDYDSYNEQLIKPLSEKYLVERVGIKTPNIPKLTKEVFQKQLFLSKIDDFIVFKPAVGYKNESIQLASRKEFEVVKKETHLIVLRNKKFEDNYYHFLKELHPKFGIQDEKLLFLSEDEFINNVWFLTFFEILKENDVEVFGYKDLKLKYNQNKPNMNVSISSDIDWFDVNIEVFFGEQIVNLKDLKKNIINRDKYIRLKDNTIGILPDDWLEKYLHLFRTGEVKKESVGVSKYQFSVVDTLYEEFQDDTNLFEEHLKIKEKISSFETVEDVRKPRGLNANLRDYQKEGLKWLNFLDDFKLGGCLADDMRLGKTIQIISFIKHLKAKHKSKVPHLIVVPTSLIFNWNEEVEKFCPSLKLLTLTGANRVKDTSKFKGFDIILTTYGIVINDIDYLKKYEFNYVILDESQAIKNPSSKRFKALRLLQAQNRLVLTGTPIENNTFDLYAQMTFVNPGLLGGVQHFKNQYATAIDKNKDKQVAKELKALIDPFLLRRTKEQVAKELPPKTEQFLYCTMGAEQRKVYDAYKAKYKNYLLGLIEDKGIGNTKMYVLEGLTKLRQICDSPSLLNDEEEYTNDSVKIDELIKHITEKTNQHKILIFSQFTKMLGLIKIRLDKLGIPYEYLDGKTRNRKQKVDNFQNDDSVRVFLISLKAGGTGLNLTAADCVYSRPMVESSCRSTSNRPYIPNRAR